MHSKYRLIPTKTTVNRIGLLGGSFNPPHIGHLHLALNSYRMLSLDQIIFLITPGNPLKQKIDCTPIDLRIQQVQDLIAPHSNIMKISLIESQLKTQYTALNLEHIKMIHQKTEFVWIMGTDNLLEFHKWFKWQHITDFAAIAIFSRHNDELKAVSSIASQFFGAKNNIQPIILSNSDIISYKPPKMLPKVTIWSMQQLHISSSEIRGVRCKS